MITILFFGRFSDIANSGKFETPRSVTDTDSLTAWLSETHQGFDIEMQRAGARIAVNKNIITEAVPIRDGDEIAFMSALSGG